MSARNLKSYQTELSRLFRRDDLAQAHLECQPLLQEMARDIGVLHEIVRENLRKPPYLAGVRINPVLAMDILVESHFSFIMHGWMPRPDRSVALTHQSIHHHGNLMLTSVAPFGPGYESILFKPDYQVDPNTLRTRMEVEKFYRNHQFNLEVIAPNTPHVVFYPESVSVTYALWSKQRLAAVDGLKGVGIISKHKKQLKKVLDATGLSKKLGLNVVQYLDFCLEDGQVLAMKERVRYPDGSHENFVQNLFHFLQKIGFEDYDFVKSLPETSSSFVHWREQFLAQKPIPDSFEEAHLHIPGVSLGRSELTRCLGLPETIPAQGGRS